MINHIAACLLALLAPLQSPDLPKILQKIEETRNAPYAQRMPWVSRLRSVRTDEARRAALELFRKETHDTLRGMLLGHAAGLSGLGETMREVLGAKGSLQVFQVAAEYLLARDGADGLRFCLELMDRKNDKSLHQAVLATLGKRDGAEERAAFLERFAKEPANTRYMVLIRLRNAKGPHLDKVRRASMTDSYAALAREAIRQLAAEGDQEALARARELADGKSPRVHASVLFEILLRAPVPGDLPRLGRLLTWPTPRMNKQLDKALPRLAMLEGAKDWAVGPGAKAKIVSVRRFAVRLLAQMQGTEVATALLRLAGDADPAVRRSAIFALAERRDERVVSVLEKAFKRRSLDSKLDALEGLDLVLGDTPEFQARLLRYAKSGPGDLRLLALDLGRRHGLRCLLALLPNLLKNKDWRLRIAGLEIATDLRDAASVPILIQALANQEGRLAEDCRRALQSLTRIYFYRYQDWQAWWKQEKATFVLPPPEEKKKQDKKPRRGARRAMNRTSSSFYGIPVVSHRVVYVLDVSGSMSAPMGTGTTRLKVAQEALIRTLTTSPKQSFVNVVFFETRVDAYAKKLAGLKKRGQLERLIDFIRGQKPRGGTNLHGALVEAMGDKRADTVFVLSDGAPSAGAITDPTALVDDILRRNRTRKIVFHCISIGTKSPLLERLARETGGRYQVQ